MCHFPKTYGLLKVALFLKGPFVREISFQIASFHIILLVFSVAHYHPESDVSGGTESAPQAQSSTVAVVLSSDSHLVAERSQRQAKAPPLWS